MWILFFSVRLFFRGSTEYRDSPPQPKKHPIYARMSGTERDMCGRRQHCLLMRRTNAVILCYTNPKQGTAQGLQP